MEELLNTSSIPSSSEDFIKMAKDYDFIHIIIVDINGIPRLKVYPADAAEELSISGSHISVCALTLAFDGNVVAIPEHVKMSFGNMGFRPIFDTARDWPWLGLKTGSKILQVFAQTEWNKHEPIRADPRQIALSQLKRLHDRDMDILVGVECEFRLFELKRDINGEPIPAHKTMNMYSIELMEKYEEFYVECNKRMRRVGFKFDAFHNEFGWGMVEFPLSADWGIKAMDDVVRFKMIVKQVARHCGLQASFMSRLIKGQSSNSSHFNHSIWRRKNIETAEENLMFDKITDDKLSVFCKHWLAGLLHHANALTSICSPTVNCYRRLHRPWAPDYIDWGIDNRMVSFRVKNGGTGNSTLIENRCPSSASNPYLVFASTIAAGLDGVDRKLELPPASSKEMGGLPANLQQALEALKKDEIMCSALGEQFIKWYGTIKVDELSRLDSVDISQDRPSDYEKERKFYFDVV